MSGTEDSLETKMDIDEKTESKNVQGGPPEMGDFDAQLNIENKSEGGVVESSTHPILGSVLEMKVPPPEYSGIPQLTAETDPELMDVKKKKKKNRKKSTEKHEMHNRDEEKSPPVLSKYDEIVLSTAASINKERITQPPLPLFDEEPNPLERDRSSPHSRRGRTERNFDSGRGEGYEDDYISRRNEGASWNRPRHGKYKYPDDFDEEDFEEDFDTRREEDYRANDDNRSHRGNYAPRSFGQGRGGGLLATPTGYGPRNYGPANFGQRQFASGSMGQGSEHMGPRGPMVGSGGPGSGSMGPVSGPMGPRAGQMGPGPGQMGPGPGQMGPGPGQMGPGQMGPGPGQMGPGPGQMGPGPGQMGPGPGQMGPGQMGPGQMGPGPGQMGPGPGQMGPGPGQMGPGPGQMGPGPGQMGPGPGQMGPGPGQMGPGQGLMRPGQGLMGPGQMGPMGPVPMGPGPGMGPPGGPMCGPGPMGPPGPPYPPRGPGFGPSIGPPIPGGYSDGYHGPPQGPPVQGFSSVPNINPFPPSQGFMPPHSQAPTFSGEVFQTGIFNPTPAMPSFLGMPPQLPPMPLADTSKPPPVTESAEKLIAQGMNPDLAKILDVNSKKPYRSDSGAGTQKQKKKKKKNKSYDQIDSDNAVNLNLDEVPLPPMSIPLPDEVPLPPEPKKKKKKSKRDKDLENVMFPPMPEEVPTVEGPPKSVSPPFVAQVLLDPINNSNQLPSSSELAPQMVSAPQPIDQVWQHDFAQSEDIKNDTQCLHWQTVSSEQSSLTTVFPAVPPPSQQIIQQQVFTSHQVEVVHVPIQSTVSQSMPALNLMQAVPIETTNVSASDQQPELSTSLLTPHASIPLSQSPTEVVDSVATVQQLQSNTQLSHVLNMPTSKIHGASQVTQALQPVLPVRRSRFDLNWTPDTVNAALPIASLQPLTAVQLPTTTTLQLPVLPSVLPLDTTNNTVITSLSMGNVSISEQGRTLIDVLQENLISETTDQYRLPQTETVELTHEHMSHQHDLCLLDQQTSSNNDSTVSLKVESCVEDKTVSDIVAEKDTSLQMDFEESVNLTLKVKDETDRYSENKMNFKEDAQTEQLVTKEPITASMLLEKFKQKQLQKSDSKNELSKYPVVVPSLISQKAIADEHKVQSDLKSQGKFTFAIRKLKQLEAEQEEEEKQVLTAVNSESEVAQKIQDDNTKHVEEGTKKEKGSKEQKQSGAEMVSKVQSRKKSRSVSRSKKSKSRSSSREKIRNKRQKSKSKDRSKSRDRGGKLHERSYEKRSRSGERRRMSRERSRSKEYFSVERKSRRSRSKERKKSLSPWRKDREFFKRYGRMPWPGEADSITAESVNTRSGGRLQRSLDRGRFRNSSRDRDIFEGKGKDRERRDIQSRNRQSTDRSREKGRREKVEEIKSRSKDRSKERGRVSTEKSSKERGRVSTEKSRKTRKVMADSSSDTESTSESDSSDQHNKREHVKQKKRISSKERERSYSPDKIKKKKERSYSPDKIKKKKERRHTPVKSKDLNKEQAENVHLTAKCEAMDTSEKILNDDIDQKKSKYVNKKSDASSIPEDYKEQAIGNVVIKQEPVDEYVEKPQIVSELLQPKPVSRNINSDSENETNALERHAKESKKDGKLKSLEDKGEEIDMKRRADKENRIEDKDVPVEDNVRQRKDLVLRSVQSRDSQEYEEKVKKRKIKATDSDIGDEQIFQESRSKSKDEMPQKRSRNVERIDEDDSIQHVAKSKWDSESDSNDDDFAHDHIEELPLVNSQRLQKEARIPLTSKSDLEKLEIDISKINQMKLLSKMMKGKGEKSCSDNESVSSDDDNDLKVKKKHKKEKQTSKKSRKEKKKKHDESDSEDEDSPVKHKKKKKTKKKKKVKNDEDTDDEFEKSRKKKKDKQINSDTDKSEDEYKGKEKGKKTSKKSKQDIDSEDSASLKSKSKTRSNKDRRRNSDGDEVEWIPHVKLQSKCKERKDSGHDSESEMPRHKEKEKNKVYSSEDEYFDEKEKRKRNDKKDKHYRGKSTERNDSYKKDGKSHLKNVKRHGRDQSEDLDLAPKHGSNLKLVHKLSPESDVESVRIKKDKRTVGKDWKQHSDSEESYKKQKGKSSIAEPSDSEMSDTARSKELDVRKRSKESEKSYKIEKRMNSKESETSYKSEEKDRGLNHKTYGTVRGDSKGKPEKNKGSDHEECSNKSDQKGRGDNKSKLGDICKNDNYEVTENILTEELSNKDKIKKTERKDSVSDKDLQDSRLSKVKQIVKERGELKERKEEIRETSNDLEKSRKRGRSCNSRSNSRSSSRTKILKTESRSRNKSNSSSPDVKIKRKTYKKESSDDDKKQTADVYAKKTKNATRGKSRKKESSSPEFHSKKRDERYSIDRRKDDESLQDLKYGKKSSSRMEISDDDYRSRKKRDVDKGKYSYDRKSATSNSCDQSSSQSSSSDSDSESDESKHYKTKTTGSKNVQAGTSFKMELVPGSLKIKNTKSLLEQNSSISAGENIVKTQKSLDECYDNTCSKAKDNFQSVPVENDCEEIKANKKLVETKKSKEMTKCLDNSEDDIDEKVTMCIEKKLTNVTHSKQETLHTENKKVDMYIGKENMLVDYDGSSSDSEVEPIELKKEDKQPDQTVVLLQLENVSGSASLETPYTENQNVRINMVDRKETYENDCKKDDLDDKNKRNLSDLYDPFEMMELDYLDTNNSTTRTQAVLSESNFLTKLPFSSVSSVSSEQCTVSLEPLKASLVPHITTGLAPITPVAVPAPLGLPDVSCISETTSQRNYEVTVCQLSFPSQTITTTGTQNANDFSLPVVEQFRSINLLTADKVKLENVTDLPKSTGLTVESEISRICPTLTVSAPGSSYSISTKQSDSNATFSKKKGDRSTQKSRWDNDNGDKLKKEPVPTEELYDPFTIETDEFLPQSPSDRKNGSSMSVAKEDSCKSEHKTLQGYTPSKKAMFASSQAMKSNVGKDTQNKVTMKFTLGRKVMGKSAIVVDEGDDSNETIEIPKLKLSTPTEITGNDSLTLSEIMKLCLEEPKKECFEKKSKSESIGEVAARTNDDRRYVSGKSRADTSPGLKKGISERSELSISRERKCSRERRRDRSISKERRLKSSNSRDRYARSCSRNRDKRYDSKNKRQRSTSGDRSHKDNLKDKHKERSHSREKKSKKRNSARPQSRENISPKVMIERQRSCSPRKRSHSPRGRNRKKSRDRNAGKSSDESSESSSDDEYASSLRKERLKCLHVFKESVFKHGKESSLKSENLDVEIELENTLQGKTFNTDEKVKNSHKTEKVGNVTASDGVERDSNMDKLVSSHMKLSEYCNITDVEVLDNGDPNASIGNYKKCIDLDEENCVVGNINIVDAAKNKKGIFFKEHSPEDTCNDTAVIDQHLPVTTHFHQQNSVTQCETENKITTEQMAMDTADLLMHSPEHVLVKRLNAVGDLVEESMEKVSHNSLLVDSNDQWAVMNLLIHTDKVMETGNSECELDQTGDVKRFGQEEKQTDHINVLKRLTRRAAAEQKVVLPPVMSKDMPTRGKKADRIAIDKSTSELTSLVEWSSENVSSQDLSIEIDPLQEQNSKICKLGSHPLPLDIKQPCTQSDQINNLPPKTKDGQLSLGQNVCHSQCEIGEIVLQLGKSAEQATNGAAINLSEVESHMNTTMSGLSDPIVQKLKSEMLTENQQEIASSASAVVKKDTKGLSIKLATKTLVKSMLPQFDDVFEISSSKHEKLKSAKPADPILNDPLASKHKPIYIKSVKSLPCEIIKSVDSNQDNKAANSNNIMPKSVDSQLVTQSEVSNLNKEASTDGSSDALNVNKDRNLAESNSSFVKKTEDLIKQTALASSENNAPNNTNAGMPSIQLDQHDKSVKLLSHISPEQIGKAIQVIGQENLRRIEVLQRKSSQLTVGNKIEVLGKTNAPDSSRIIAAESLEKSRIINELASKLQVLTANVVQIQSRPSIDQNLPRDQNPPQIPKDTNLYCLQKDTNATDISQSCLPNQQNLTLQPNIQNTDHLVGIDNELTVLGKEKEQLLYMLHTQELVPEQRFEAVVTRKYSDDMPANLGGSEKYPTSTKVSKESNNFEIRSDRYDDDRYNKSDYDKRRQNIRDRRLSSRERSLERGSRERSLERAGRRRISDRNRSHDREKSREKDRSRSRERRHTRRYRDDKRYRDNKLSRRYSRSRSWSKDKRSRSRDRRSRSRGCRSRDHGRNRSRDRRSKSRDRSRSRDWHRKKKSRSQDRVRKNRSRSGSRDIDKKSDRERNEKSCKESALEKFEKVLAEKKKIFLQPATSTSQSSTQHLSHDHDIHHFADVQGQYPVHDTAVHFLPQPFPVHQQSQPFPLPHPMSEHTYPAFPMDPNIMFHQHIGSQFYHEAVPPQLPMTAPFQGLPGHFQPEMFPPVTVPQPVEPHFLPHGPPGQAHPLMPNFSQFVPDMSHMGHDNSHFGAEICFVPDGQEHRHVDETRHYKRGRSYQQYSEEVDVNTPEVKHGIAGHPGTPGLYEVKIKLRTSLDQQPFTERKQTVQNDTAESKAALEQLPYIEGPTKHSDFEECDASNVQKIEPETQILSSQKTENRSNENVSKVHVDKTTGFGQWTPVSPKKENEFPVEQGMVAEGGSAAIAEGDKFVKSFKSTLVSEIDADSTPSTEELFETDIVGKPMKLRSRWHQASEIETPPPPPPPTRVKERKGPRTVMKDGKVVVIGPDEKIEEDAIPIDFELIDENVHLAERKRSKQMREVRRMVCDCTTSKEDRDMGYEACGEDCLNRMLFIECGSKCPCGEYCTNKRFQSKLNAKVIPFKTDWKGHGLKAVEDLEPGGFVMEYVGEVLDYPLFKKRSKQYSKAGQQHFYFMAISPEEIVDATVKGNVSRFINHSCDPNCETQKWTVNGSLRVGFFVKKPIKKDEEITFDYKYEVYGQEAQKCFCGTDICRGLLGGNKRIELRSSRRSTSVDELERKKKELFDDSDKLEEEIERMSELEEGLRNKNDVLNICRLMVRAEDPLHRMQILKVLENTTETACLRLFLDYHGLPLVWCWMADVKEALSDLKPLVMKILRKLPVTNKTILKDSKILDIVEKWSIPAPEEVLETTEIIEQLPENSENTEDDSETLLSPPVSLNKNPISILASLRDKKSVKKSVKFADEASSSDSESRASASESDVTETVEGDVTSSSNVKDVKTKRYALRKRVLKKDGPVITLADLENEDVIQSTDADSSSENQSSSSQGKELGTVETTEVKQLESKSLDSVQKNTNEEITESKNCEQGDKGESGISDRETEELECIVKAAEIKNMAAGLLEHWSGLKEIYKIPKKQVLEERKKTERELDTNYEKISKIEDRKKKESGWETDKSRKRKWEVRDDPDESDLGTARKSLLATLPRLSKSERRQLFEAKVKEWDELAAEYQHQQEMMQQEQFEREQMVQQQHQRQLMQDPSFWFYATQDPSFLPSIGIDPQQFLQQLAMDPVLLQQLMATVPNFPQQLEHLTLMYQQAVLQASQQEMQQLFLDGVQPLQEPTDELMTEQHMAFLQQVEAFKQQHLESKLEVTSVFEDDDVPPPPSPPKGKAVVLPPNWKTAKDAEGKMYYYHTVTRQTQWDPPNLDTGEHADDMDLGTPTLDDITKEDKKEEREKTTTAAADTSSETSRKLKEQFKSKMSSWIVVCLNPFRKSGKITNTEDFKHLARKLTHHVMAKELKHCRHVEDLEVNENVKSKAKDFVKKYMTKFGSSYKRSGNSPTYD